MVLVTLICRLLQAHIALPARRLQVSNLLHFMNATNITQYIHEIQRTLDGRAANEFVVQNCSTFLLFIIINVFIIYVVLEFLEKKKPRRH